MRAITKIAAAIGLICMYLMSTQQAGRTSLQWLSGTLAQFALIPSRASGLLYDWSKRTSLHEPRSLSRGCRISALRIRLK
jgi:hypothetical protein